MYVCEQYCLLVGLLTHTYQQQIHTLSFEMAKIIWTDGHLERYTVDGKTYINTNVQL
jgi:hypothetical protein